LRILSEVAIKRHSHLPGPRKDFWVLDCGFVIEGVRADGCVAFNYMQRVTMEIAGPIKPRLVVKARHVDDQRIALPMANRPPHPCIIGTLQLAIHVDGSSGARELIGHEDVLRSLHYLKWVRHIR